ncbi:MAG: SGNH/GDSL hydrolase family protein [Lachnospiraceae bacterium]|nr:SGNH/GDSL hydrolase family protein [Lachnospiraceae bacterium]
MSHYRWKRLLFAGTALAVSCLMTLQGPVTAQAAAKTQSSSQAKTQQSSTGAKTQSSESTSKTQSSGSTSKTQSGGSTSKTQSGGSTSKTQSSGSTSKTKSSSSSTNKKTTGQTSGTKTAAAPKQVTYAPIVTPPTETVPGVELTFLTGENALIHETAVTNAFVTATQLIPNLTGQDNVLSMAGGVEALSFYAVTYSGPNAEVSTPDRINVVIPLTQALNGRTLRVGETIRAVYECEGLFYLAETVIDGQQVVVSIPHLVGVSSVPVLDLIVGRGFWAPGEGLDYLAIGNSITMHPKREYWPNAMGMGASSIEKDYFHLTTAGIEKKYGIPAGSLNAAAMNFAIWESNKGNRQYALTLLDPYLSPQLDIVSIQLGENFLDQENFPAEYTKLISYVRGKCPSAQIILVGTFWQNDLVEQVKQQNAAAFNAAYVSLAPIQNKVDYLFGTGYVYDAAGNPYYSTNGGTALHPNNAAMKFIADGIINALQ